MKTASLSLTKCQTKNIYKTASKHDNHIDIIPTSPYQCYYAALLPRRGPHIASLSVCPSVPLSNVTSRHLANYNDTHLLLGTRRGPHIVRPSRPHKILF